MARPSHIISSRRENLIKSDEIYLFPIVYLTVTSYLLGTLLALRTQWAST